MAEPREVAFYYPGFIWRDPSWVKSLALFFDEVALLVPDYMRDRPAYLDPAIVSGLEQAELLRILSPEELVDKEATERLTTSLADVLAAGLLDELPDTGHFEEISWSRLGGYGDLDLAQMLFEELESRGLAKPSADGASIPLHPIVRSLVLVLLAQILRSAGPRLGLELSPATDRPEVQGALVQLLGVKAESSKRERVVEMDLDFVGPNLDSIPLDEVLDFRKAHGDEYRAYARSQRAIVRELAEAPPETEAEILAARRDEILEAGEILRKVALTSLGAKAAVGLGVAGGVASALADDTVGGILSASSAAVGLGAQPAKVATQYSYLFAIKRDFA